MVTSEQLKEWAGGDGRPIVSFVLFALVVAVLARACGFLPETRSWTEGVQLDDGSVITIERYVRFNESNSLSGDAYSATETKATLSFTGELKSLPVWDTPLMPVLLYRDPATKEWVVVAATASCEVWHRRGKPMPPYWEFNLSAAGWRQRPLSSSSLNRDANLFSGYTGGLQHRHLSVKGKLPLITKRTVAETYRRIVPTIRTSYC